MADKTETAERVPMECEPDQYSTLRYGTDDKDYMYVGWAERLLTALFRDHKETMEKAWDTVMAEYALEQAGETGAKKDDEPGDAEKADGNRDDK
jgi:hypothetical protein